MNRIELNNVTPFVAIPVGEVIKDELEARHMKQSELSRFMDFQVQSELDSARINNRIAQQVKCLDIWKAIKEKIDIPSLKKSGVIKGEVIEDVKRMFKMFEVDSVEDLLCKIG